jgi:hypothetical protein
MKYFALVLPCIICLASALDAQSYWTTEQLKRRSADNQDSSKWNLELLKRDIDNQDGFGDLPMNKGAFPVADYDYYVTANPFHVHGISVGENADGKKNYHFTILILSGKDAQKKDSDLAFSRNYPYFTAEGYFEINGKRFDWLTASSPDGFSLAFVNMKLFDLRFGKTVFIFPHDDGSFRYLQLQIDPNRYEDFEAFKKDVMEDTDVNKEMAK